MDTVYLKKETFSKVFFEIFFIIGALKHMGYHANV